MFVFIQCICIYKYTVDEKVIKEKHGYYNIGFKEAEKGMSKVEKGWRQSIGADLCKNCAIQLVNNKLQRDYREGSYVSCKWSNIRKSHDSQPAFFEKISGHIKGDIPADEIDDDDENMGDKIEQERSVSLPKGNNESKDNLDDSDPERTASLSENNNENNENLDDSDPERTASLSDVY